MNMQQGPFCWMKMLSVVYYFPPHDNPWVMLGQLPFISTWTGICLQKSLLQQFSFLAVARSIFLPAFRATLPFWPQTLKLSEKAIAYAAGLPWYPLHQSKFHPTALSCGTVTALDAAGLISRSKFYSFAKDLRSYRRQTSFRAIWNNNYQSTPQGEDLLTFTVPFSRHTWLIPFPDRKYFWGWMPYSSQH